VCIVERAYRLNESRKLGGGLKDMPLCERCGRPVRVSSGDYTDDEILCTSCEAEARVAEIEDYQFDGSQA
jgi:hypothetical protein